jgi:dihydroflavonol-4-reductase
MKVLVTGATGLVGGNLVRVLLEAGHEVAVLVRAGSDASTLRGLAVQPFTGDVLEPSSLGPAMEGCELVFHAAAVFAYWGYTRAALEDIAVGGTRNVLTAARAAGVRRLVMTSSSVVLGASATPRERDETCDQNEANPSSYTRSKVAQEQAAFETARALGLDLVVVCPTLTVGAHDYRLSPSNGNVANYLNDPLRCTFTGGCNIVSARDVAAGHLLAAEAGAGGRRYVLGSDNLRWRDVYA